MPATSVALLITLFTLAAEAAPVDTLLRGSHLDLAPRGLAQPLPPAPEVASLGSGRARDFLMEVNFRGRYLFLPDTILDTWYFNEGDTPGHLARPSLRAWTTGLEYVLKKDNANGIFYVEYMGFLLDEGYWDDRENPPRDTDGSWLRPDRLGMVNVGANYAYELHTNEKWLSFLFGTGLGIGVITGGILEWKPGPSAVGDMNCEQGNGVLGDPTNATAIERYLAGCGDDGEIGLPPVLPVVDLNLGVRFNFSDRANLRLETGFHDMLYAGIASGVVF
jgi:hypothetical protein